MTRAVSSVVGKVSLVLITIVLAGVPTASVATAWLDQPEPEFASISATATPDGTIYLTHEGGHTRQCAAADRVVPDFRRRNPAG